MLAWLDLTTLAGSKHHKGAELPCNGPCCLCESFFFFLICVSGWLFVLVPAYAGTHTHPFNGPFPGLPRWASTRKVKPIWILLKQETVSGIGISWAICKSAPRSRQITMPTPHYSVFYRPDALPAAQPTASKHWRQPAYPGSPRQKVVKATKQLYVCVCVFHWVIEKLRDIAVWNTV